MGGFGRVDRRKLSVSPSPHRTTDRTLSCTSSVLSIGCMENTIGQALRTFLAVWKSLGRSVSKKASGWGFELHACAMPLQRVISLTTSHFSMFEPYFDLRSCMTSIALTMRVKEMRRQHMASNGKIDRHIRKTVNR